MLADVDYELAPHAVMHLSWYERAREFIREHVPGGDLQCYNWDGTTDLYGVGVGRPVIATGPSPRGNFKHCVMADSATGEILHDPHPSRAGLLAIELVDAIVPLNDPANLPMAPMLALPVGGIVMADRLTEHEFSCRSCLHNEHQCADLFHLPPFGLLACCCQTCTPQGDPI